MKQIIYGVYFVYFQTEKSRAARAGFRLLRFCIRREDFRIRFIFFFELYCLRSRVLNARNLSAEQTGGYEIRRLNLTGARNF